MHDEFELLDFNADWVHVRISGLSRGWIWRNSVEMPEGIADTDTTATIAPRCRRSTCFTSSGKKRPRSREIGTGLRSKNVKIHFRAETR